MTRLQATVALLQGLLDYHPWPETWTGELQRRATNAGPAPFRRVVCDECQGRGKTRSGWMCTMCKGRGRYDVDDYTLEIVDSTITPFRELLARFVNCSVCGGWGRLSADSNTRPTRDHKICDDCSGTGRVPAPFTGVFRADANVQQKELTGDRVLDALDKGHERRDDVAVYRDHLLPALHTLKQVDGYGGFLVEWVWVLGAQTPESLPGPGLVRLLRGTRLVESVMPDRVEKLVPGEIRAQHDHQAASRVKAKGRQADKFAQRARDDEIRRLHHRGASLDELAQRFNLDKSRISRITRKDSA